MDWKEKYINKIVCGDCLSLMRELPDGCIDLVFADPWYYPENQKTRNAFEDDIFWMITEKWLIEILRIIKKSGHIFIAFSPQKMAKFEFVLAKLVVPLKSRIIWHYRNAGGRCADKGQFGKTYEMIYHFGFADTLNFPKEWTDERFDVWIIATPQSNYSDKKIHPFQKPIKLAERIIRLGSQETDLILDPFAGSGTTLVAAKNLGRRFIGMEINPDYVKICEDRLRQEILL